MSDADEVLNAYQSMPETALRKLLVLEYRGMPCGCPLLRVWNEPAGRMYYLPRYRLSPAKAAADTTESARRKRTEDGLRVFRARAGSFDNLLDDYADFPTSAGLSMNCDHLRNVFVPFERLTADAAAGRPGRHAQRRVAKDGTVTA